LLLSAVIFALICSLFAFQYPQLFAGESDLSQRIGDNDGFIFSFLPEHAGAGPFLSLAKP
jgi:hypothetical protein